MEDKKITMNLTTVIVIFVIIVVILLGIIGYLMYNSARNSISQNNNTYADNTNDKIMTSNIEENNTIGKNIISTNSENSNTINQNVKGEKSSKANPLSIGKWGRASKYFSGKYVDVPTRVTKVTRGSIAAQEVEKYCNTSTSIYQYKNAEENMEWAIIDYEVDLTSFESDTSISLDRKITGIGDNTSIKYNGYTYITSTMNMTSGTGKSKIIPARFAVQLPIGCKDYLICLGSATSTQAFFVGQ